MQLYRKPLLDIALIRPKSSKEMVCIKPQILKRAGERMQELDKFAANADGGVCKQCWVRPKLARVPARKSDMPRLVPANSVEGANDNAGPSERFRNRCKYHADAGVERGDPGEMKRGVSARHT
jgi:hypothetical protein